jgi:hypothetical protein
MPADLPAAFADILTTSSSEADAILANDATSSNNARSPEAINSPVNGINEGLLGAKMKIAYVVTDFRKSTTRISPLPSLCTGAPLLKGDRPLLMVLKGTVLKGTDPALVLKGTDPA